MNAMTQVARNPAQAAAQSTTPVLRAELPLDLAAFVSPSTLMTPAYVDSPAAAEQLPFLCWLLDTIIPRVIVDVGAADATVHFGLCQAAEALTRDIRCHLGAVSLNPGDAHASATIRSWIEHQNKHHAARSQIIGGGTGNLSEVLQDTSVDILVLHAAGASPEQLQQWKAEFMPLLSPHSAVFIDGLGDGRHAFFDELASQGNGFRFQHGTGFGVVAGGEEPPRLLGYLATQAADAGNADALRSLFQRLGLGCRNEADQRALRSVRRKLRALAEDLSRAQEDVSLGASRLVAHEAEIVELRDRLDWHREQLEGAQRKSTALQTEGQETRGSLMQLQATLETASRALDAERKHAAALRESEGQARRSLQEVESELALRTKAGKQIQDDLAICSDARRQQEQAAASIRQQARALRDELDLVYSSRSWKFTAPLRRAMARFRR